jgi:rhodanese-related sulfurtransferase
MNKVTVIAIIIIVGLGVIWFSNKVDPQDQTTNSNSATKKSVVRLVTPAEFATLAKEKNAFIVDVHTPEQTHIPGTDAVIPFDQIQENKSKLPEDTSTPILVYCRSGGMSAQASQEIARLGYTNIFDLDGGTNAYKEQQVSVQLWPDKQDLGTVIYGDVTTTSFTLTNYTPLPLKITRVSTSCGCTKASVEKEALGAYESTTVNVSFDPAVHEDDTDLGELTRTIYVETDNPNYSDLESTIKASVVKNN